LKQAKRRNRVFQLVLTILLAFLAGLVTSHSQEPDVGDTRTVSDTTAKSPSNDSPDTAATRVGVAPDDVRQCPVTNVFYDTDLREVLQTMASQCFVNVVADETVSGLITVELDNVPLEEAMQRVLNPFGLTYRWLGGYYLVGSPRPSNPSFPFLTETELYRPDFIKAADVPKLMSTFYEPFMRVNDTTNTLTLTASPELIARMKVDLAEIDKPPRQVMIEALVTETSSDISRLLGISWQAAGSSARDSIRIDAYPKASGDSAFLPNTDMFGAFFQRIGIRSGTWVGNFRAQLDALIRKGKARIRANPRVATLEGNQARIFIGREEYFSLLTGAIAYTYARLEVIKTGISLTITPYVSRDGFITLEVQPEVSDVVGTGSSGLPATNMRSVTTKIRVAQGETAVIGGLKVTDETVVKRKVPLLGSIPILGYLFQHVEKRTVESEITVLITPYLWQPTGNVESGS
jgi:type II secretory pathway component GspD/PulD (secretin)